jgi:hypothetical protein
MNITRKEAKELYSIFSLNKMEEPKLNWVFQRNIKKLKSIVEDTNDLIEEQRLSLVSVDEKGNTIVENGGYKFTPDNLKELNKKIKEINNETVEFEPYKFTKEHQSLEEFNKLGNDFIACYSDIIIEND